MSFTKKTIMIEEVPAWEECGECRGACGRVYLAPDGEELSEYLSCPYCNGDGGKWHSAVEISAVSGWASIDNISVNKSSILTCEHDVCKDCPPYDWTHTVHECPVCNGTGAEPDTAGEWRVK